MRRFVQRRHPAHPPPIIRLGRTTLVFVTVCVAQRRPLLANEFAHGLLRECWEQAAAWKIGRYVVMPDHVHFFCAPFDLRFPLKPWMQFWRNRFTRGWPRPSEKPVWQPDFWDTQMRVGDSYAAKWDYVRRNPVRHGLVAEPEQWLFQGEIETLMWHDA